MKRQRQLAKLNQTVNPRQPRKGAALVEAALVLPVFFMAIVGIVEFGRGMMVTQLVTNTAREAARQAILDGSTNVKVTDFAKTSLAGAASAEIADVDVTISVVPAQGSGATGNQLATTEAYDLITVEVAIPYDKISFFTGKYLGGKTLSASATMRHE